jgi:hypothetical protein
MELKDLVLSTLNEMDAEVKKHREPIEVKPTVGVGSDERKFLLNSKEKLEVLFQGLNHKDTKKVEAKVDLVTNFLQFYLSEVDKRLDKCPK